MDTSRLRKMMKQAEPHLSGSISDFEAMFTSKKADDRLKGIIAMRLSIECGLLPPSQSVIKKAQYLINDADNDCRWQSCSACAWKIIPKQYGA